MVVFLLFCYDLLLYCIDFLILTKFMDAQYGEPRCTHTQRNILLILIAGVSAALLWNSPFGGTYPFFSVIFSFAFLIFYEGNQQNKLLFSAIQLVISGYLVMLTIALLRSFDVNLKYININYYISLGSMHLIFWLLILLLWKLSPRNPTILPNRFLSVVLAIPVSSLLVLFFFLIRINNNADILFSLEVPLLCVFIFINITTAFIYSKFCNLLSQNNEILLLKQQLNLSAQHFQNLTDSQEKLKGVRHDMKNHLQALLLMSKQTPLQTSDMQVYIKKLLSNVNDTSQIISTGNLGVDSILSLKITQIKEKQIPISSKIILPKGIHMSFDESIIVLGNILDNALEACEKLPPENRWIRLEINYVQQALFIRISNPLPTWNQKIPVDESEHGFGLKNVHTVVRNHNGTMNIKRDNEVFSIKIVMYNI